MEVEVEKEVNAALRVLVVYLADHLRANLVQAPLLRLAVLQQLRIPHTYHLKLLRQYHLHIHPEFP